MKRPTCPRSLALGLALLLPAALALAACGSSSDGDGGGAGATGGSASGGSGGSAAQGGGGAGGSEPLELLHRAGRFDDSSPAGPVFSWSGTSLGARWQGDAVGVHLAGAADIWFEIVLDGASTGAFVTTGGDASYLLAGGLPAGEHDIEIVRRNEGFFGDVTFVAFDVTGGALVPSPSPYRHRLEFIGDSVTCGYGVLGPDAFCSFSGDTESAYLSYAAIAARALGASAPLVAYSGKGVFQNYGGDQTELMPELYLRTLTNDPASSWDFARYTPEAVVVNLGSNDFSVAITESDFVTAYVGLLAAVRGYYPAAHVFCVSWESWGATAQGYVAAAIAAFGDAAVSEVPFVVDANDGWGCDYHPGQTMQAKLGAELASAIQATLGW